MAFVSSPSPNSTNEVPADFGVSTATPQVSTANLSDATVYAFLANQPNRVPRNHENITRNQETTRRTMNVEDTSSKAMVAIDGASFYWSYMADDEALTNMAFMALSGLEESDEEDKVESPPEKERKTVAPSVDKSHSYKQIEDQGYFNNGCSRHMIGNISYLTDFKEFNGGCDNGREFKNRVVNDFCEEKGIKKEYSVARTP
nr:ribonuclease H-like domain-containing protein [Tanacetum cinerariifolium]